MGKDFHKELQNLNEIYKSAQDANVQVIVEFLNKYRNHYILAIGSGGSYSVAKIFEYLCTKAGICAKCVTPLELSQYEKQIKKMACVLFSAGGRNADSRNTYSFLSNLEADGILTCCMSLNSPIKKMQSLNLHNYFFEHKMPVAKDGYLSVESMISFAVVLSKAFEEFTGDLFFKLQIDRIWQHFTEYDDEFLNEVLSKETIIVLHSGISTPAACDLESKFSEVSLGNIQVVDFRNFAHGRHFWLVNRREKTSIIALVGSNVSKLVDKTLNLLPDEIPVVRKEVSEESIDGLFELLDYVFFLTEKTGILRNINPGMPHVEDFEKKLYHISYNIANTSDIRKLKKDTMAAAIYRKDAYYSNDTYKQYYSAANYHLNILTNRHYKGIVFDYDGTLHDKHTSSNVEIEIFDKINLYLESGIQIGIATGRGKSVRSELRKVIKPEFWSKVVIAYYNGGCLGTLDDNTVPNKHSQAIPQAFETIMQLIGASYLYNRITIDGMSEKIGEKNPYQLTIIFDDNSELYHYKQQLFDIIHEVPDIKIVESSHSIDIIPSQSSKNKIFNMLDLEFSLNIGDSGNMDGNDYELLRNENSLSVDTVSSSINSCWNFAPIGIRNLEATLYYLNRIELLQFGKEFIIRL